MPFFFLLFVAFMLCAVISPLVAAGVIRALCTERWRDAGARAGKTGASAATVFILMYFACYFLEGQDSAVQPLSIAVAGGAGFTIGALGAWAWIWNRARNAPAVAH